LFKNNILLYKTINNQQKNVAANLLTQKLGKKVGRKGCAIKNHGQKCRGD
jgi:hypothetical protein